MGPCESVHNGKNPAICSTPTQSRPICPWIPGAASSVSTQHPKSWLQEIESRIAAKALGDGVLAAKGSLFSWDKKPGGQLHFRVTFAAADKGDLEEGVKLLANTLKGEFASGLS